MATGRTQARQSLSAHSAPTPHEAGTIINKLMRHAAVLEEIPDVRYSSDSDDNPILAPAIAGQAF